MSDPFAREPAPSSEPAPVAAPSLPYTPGEFVVIRDPLPWAEPVRLSGVLERQRFHPLLTALLTFVLGFLVYQIVGTVVTVVAALQLMGATEGQSAGEVAQAVMEAAMSDAAVLIGGNAVGQFAGFLFFVWFVAWLHTPDTRAFLRVRRADPGQLVLGAVGWLAIVPLVSWLGEVNGLLPVPEFLEEFEAQQALLIEQVLGAELHVLYVLLVVALTPAICEEVMFRGYLQRQVERRLGVVWSIVLVGLVFGLFHLRPTEILPLATLGMYLGFAVWVTGSLWAGVLVHLLNNGLAVLVSDYMSRSPDLDPAALESISVPWYLALASALAVAAIAALLVRRRDGLLARLPA
jgi:membrane protease YdiL (CAAX protease family)